MMTTSNAPLAASSSFRGPALVAALVFAPFTAFTTWLCIRDGYTGFLSLAAREPWGLQMLLDLSIAMTFVMIWMFRQERARKRAAWPWVVAALFLGSPVALLYVIVRGLRNEAQDAA